MYTVGRLIEDGRRIASDATGQYFQDIAIMAAEETLTDFYSRDWPFASGEGAITTIAPYTTGTVTLTNGSQAVTGSGTTWLTNWPVPAVIRPEGANGEAFIVTAVGSGTGLTIDRPFPFATAAAQTYSIEFPSYPISEYINVQAVCLPQSQWAYPLQISSMESILYNRPWGTWISYPLEFFVMPGDGTASASLVINPAPSMVQTIRFRYTNAIPAFSYLIGTGAQGGTASIAAAGTAVTGVGTTFLKLGYTLVGHYFEIPDQDGIYSLVGDVPTDTSLTVAAWGGTAVTNSQYSVSSKIVAPDDFRPMLRDLMRWKYFQNDNEPALANEAQKRYQRNYSLAMTRMNRMRGPGSVQGIDLGDDGANSVPSRPWSLQMSYSPP